MAGKRIFGPEITTRVIKRIGDSHVVWFPESNRWIEFREPAWYIYKKYQAGKGSQNIISELKKRYELPESEARRFYTEITEGINHAMQGGFDPMPGLNDGSAFAEYKFSPCNTHHYLFNNKRFTIIYGSPLLENYIHRPLMHIETITETRDSQVFELFEIPGSKKGNDPDKRYALRQEGKKVYTFAYPGHLKHKLYIEITSHLYDISTENWMSFIHASAITNGDEAILLSSASGNGKSTMAALLLAGDSGIHQEGQHGDSLEIPANEIYLLSDDFVPVDAEKGKAWPFPAALSAKKGAFAVINNYYDPATDVDAAYRGKKDRNIRYLRPRYPVGKPFHPVNVNKIIFIRYNISAGFQIEKIPVTKALAMFHEEAWVSHNPGHAQKFIDWFTRLECYRLEYSDNKKAKESIRKLFQSK